MTLFPLLHFKGQWKHFSHPADMYSCKRGIRCYCNYWALAVARRANLHEVYLNTHTHSSAEQPRGQGSGLAQPTENDTEVKDTHSRKKVHPSVLVRYTVAPFSHSHPNQLTFSPSPLLYLLTSSQGCRKWEGGKERETIKIHRDRT